MHVAEVDRAQERVEGLREELRAEVAADLRAGARRRWWQRKGLRCGGCCGVYLCVLIGIPLLACYVIARTGLVDIPFMSARITHMRAPVRVVAPISVSSIEEWVTAKLRAAARAPHAASLAITVTDADLTGLLRAAIARDPRIPDVVRRSAQMTVHPDGVEGFARIPGFGQAETTLQIIAVPRVGGSGLDFTIRAVAIGNLGIPHAIATRVFDAWTNGTHLPLQFGTGAQAVVIERVVLGEGSLSIELRK